MHPYLNDLHLLYTHNVFAVTNLDGDFDDKEVSDRLHGDVKKYVAAVSLATSGHRVAVDDATRSDDAISQTDHRYGLPRLRRDDTVCF